MIRVVFDGDEGMVQMPESVAMSLVGGSIVAAAAMRYFLDEDHPDSSCDFLASAMDKLNACGGLDSAVEAAKLVGQAFGDAYDRMEA